MSDRGVRRLTRPPGTARKLAEVIVHRPKDLPAKDVLLHSAVPVTTPTRTLLDLATTRHFDRALNEAQVKGILDTTELRRRGGPRIRAALQDTRLTRSEAERMLLRLIARARLPQPETNVRLHGHEVDALWPRHRLIAEVDGFAYHRTRRSFDDDRRRDQTLTTNGYRVIRLTYTDLTKRPEATVATLTRALAINPQPLLQSRSRSPTSRERGRADIVPPP